MKTIFFPFLIFLGFGAQANADGTVAPNDNPALDSLASVQAECATFKQQIQAKGWKSGYLEVPEDRWNPDNTGKMKIYWWLRPGQPGSDPQKYPPLAFIHGGVAASSHALISVWASVLENYPGDFIAFDHRGEGCSKVIGSNVKGPEAYEIYRIRHIVEDIEDLRKALVDKQKYGESQRWQIFGHSRGSAIVHHLLEKHPQAIISAAAMGYAFHQNEQYQLNYYAARIQGFSVAAKAFLLKHPQGDQVFSDVRKWIDSTQPIPCWNGLDHLQVCGSKILDVYSRSLSNSLSWDTILAPHIDQMRSALAKSDFTSLYNLIEGYFSGDLYGHFNYINYTNGLDLASMDIADVARAAASIPPDDPFASEARWITTVAQARRQMGDAPIAVNSIEPLSLEKLASNLRQYSIKFSLYSGAADPYVPPAFYSDESQFLTAYSDGLFHYEEIPGYAHNAYFAPTVLNLFTK